MGDIIDTANDPLNDKQRLFAREYIIDHNAAAAARRAGYAQKDARKTGWRLTHTDTVAAEIARLEADIANELGATAAWVVQGFIDVYNDAMTGAPRSDRNGNIIEYEGSPIIEKGLAAANQALDRIGRMHGLFTDRTEVTHTGTVYTLHIDTDLHPDGGDDGT